MTNENTVGSVKAGSLKKSDKLIASEALFGFCGWLTSRKKITVMSSTYDVGVIVELIKIFCEKNKLPEPRKDWDKNLIHPDEGWSSCGDAEDSEDDPLKFQVGGDHYKHFKIQPVEFIAANKLSFLEGCIIKRICRQKPRDLDKIKHEISLIKKLGDRND